MLRSFCICILFMHTFLETEGMAFNTCNEFLKSRPELISVDHHIEFRRYIYLTMENHGPEYDIRSMWEFDAMFSANESVTFCLGLREAVVLTELEGVQQVFVDIGTNENIPVGVLEINSTCWFETANFLGCRTSLLLAPKLLYHGMFSFSPLAEGFWTSLQDSQVPHQDWLQIISIETNHGSIPPQWVSKASLSSLRELWIQGNTWGSPERLLGKLPNLTKLLLMNNSIIELPKDTFLNLPSLKTALLQVNNLTRLPAHLSNISNLAFTEQSGTGPLEMTDDEILNLRNLRVIDLNTPIQANIISFLKLPSLQTFNCRECRLETISKQNVPLDTYSSLTHMGLASNNLTSLPENIFEFLTKLYVLELNSNQFDECPCKALSNLQKLWRLNLSNNKLSKIPSSCFYNLNNLNTLDLSSNAITFINPSTFTNLTKLFYLNLQKNLLSTLDGNVFLPLTKLIRLDLSYNKLKESPVLGSNNIAFLGLAHNLITKITNVTTLFKYILLLDLSGNRMTEFWLEKVHRVNLSYNYISYIDENMRGYLGNLTMVDLGGNNLDCCHENISLIREWVNVSSGIIRNLNTNASLTCVPKSGEARVLLEDLTDVSVCFEKESNLLLEAGLPMGILIVCVLIFFTARHYYQFQFSYVGYFLKMKKKRFFWQDDTRLNNCVYDAFVCYSGKNLSWITEQLIPTLENGSNQYRFCLHDRDFAVGAPIDKNIIQSLEKSRKVMFLLTKDFLSSTWCQWELNMANHKTFKENRGYIVFIEMEELDQSALPSHIKHLIASRTYIKWPHDTQDERRIQKFWQQLQIVLGDSVLKKPGSNPPKGTVLDM